MLETWYFNTFRSTELLSAEEEIALVRQCHDGDALRERRAVLDEQLGRASTHEEWAEHVGTNATELRRRLARASRATDHMVAANMRLIVAIVRRFMPQVAATGSAMSMEDLVQEGSLGLLKAVSRFDPERGLRFSTMATWWVRAAVQRAIADKARTIRLPAAKFRLLAKAKVKHAELQHRLDRPPEVEELAAELQVSLQVLDGVLRHWALPCSLQTPLPGTESTTLLDLHGKFATGQALAPVESVEVGLVRAALERQLEETLTPLEAQ
eukprot:1517782-Prymnesium_polylepis.1